MAEQAEVDAAERRPTRQQFWTWAISFSVLCLGVGWFGGKAGDSLWWFVPAIALLILGIFGGSYAKRREWT